MDGRKRGIKGTRKAAEKKSKERGSRKREREEEKEINLYNYILIISFCGDTYGVIERVRETEKIIMGIGVKTEIEDNLDFNAKIKF